MKKKLLLLLGESDLDMIIGNTAKKSRSGPLSADKSDAVVDVAEPDERGGENADVPELVRGAE